MTIDSAASALATSDVARLLNVTTKTVHVWVKSGQLTSYRTTSGLHLFTIEEVARFQRERGAK